MPSIAAVLNAEIARIARKAVRDETSRRKKAIAPYGSALAALKRRTQRLERQVLRSQQAVTGAGVPAHEPPASGDLRFSAKGMAGHRRRLGLSKKDVGQLIGASVLSVHRWEQGEFRPQHRCLPAIAAIRRIGKREAAARLNGHAR